MAKVTSKLQVTLPKRLADQFGIRPGDEILWEAQPDAIRVTKERPVPLTLSDRLRLFDQTTQRAADRRRRHKGNTPRDRGWTRDELYTRGRPR